MLVYAVTIFLSAFLLFQVQPLIAKFILPWFGGSAAVWNAALLFFQLLLLAGYFYAHCLIRYLKPKQQFWTHLTLLTVSFATLPIIPSAYWKPTGGADPTFRIIVLLGATIGLPYMLLAATSPLLQAWYLRAKSSAVPYRLFALSNFGSMLALLSYPIAIEPKLTLSRQAVIWSTGYVAFALVCALAAWKSKEGIAPVLSEEHEKATPPGFGTIVLWILLAACASTLLLGTTTHLTQNVAPIPLLWVVPLSLYLLSFILAFESDHIYQRWLFLPLLVGALGLFTWGLAQSENNGDIKKTIAALCGALFVTCMFCHGELAKHKPHPRYLTQFYLMVSVGGALGGLFVALGAPRLFKTYLEMPVAVAACGFLLVAVLWRSPMWLRLSLLIAAAGFAVYLGRVERDSRKPYILIARNFYGVMSVRDDLPEDESPGQRVLIHGTINHGTEVLMPGGGRIATSYFGTGTGISRAIRAKGEAGPIRIGILGLGAGVTAALARAGDTLHYYEINPLVVDIAQSKFDFWKECPADKKLFLGDGRLVLESLPSENLDVLAMDAFSSDSVPIHLLTREAYQTYLKHLKPDGVLIINVSNRYLDLEPVIGKAMAEMGWHGLIIADDGVEQPYYTSSTFIVLSHSEDFFKNKLFNGYASQVVLNRPEFHPWTDDYSNIIQILKK
jgi:spermidine synthase